MYIYSIEDDDESARLYYCRFVHIRIGVHGASAMDLNVFHPSKCDIDSIKFYTFRFDRKRYVKLPQRNQRDGGAESR